MILYLSKYDDLFLKCIAFLIQNNRLKIKFIRPKEGKGIAHYKSALFQDKNENYALVKGSCNFSAYGFEENLEEAEITPAWMNEQSKLKVEEFRAYFNDAWEDKNPNIDHVLVGELESRISKHTGEVHKRDLVAEIEEEYQFRDNIPNFPYINGPREYQKVAYQRWKEHNCTGLFAMATGTGKTLTSLNCVLREYQDIGYYRAFVFVPTISLLDQWIEEAKGFNFQNIFAHGRLKSTDRKRFSALKTLDSIEKQSFIYIMTYDSMVSVNMKNEFQSLLLDCILIADEAHNVGAKNARAKWLSIISSRQKVIALSATPNRQYEDNIEFTKSCFNDEPPYTFEYSMGDAIKNGILCNYEYFPISVSLTSQEFSLFEELTEKISAVARIEDNIHKDLLETLLLKRRRIINNAENKLSAFEYVINKNYSEFGSLSYSLVYSPEGFEPDSNERRIFNYSKTIRAVDEKVTVRQFTGRSDIDREAVLNHFESGELDVLISMKCLDEGVDLPRAEFGYFLSSTGNPRQFIQRRGRLLRNHPDKRFAKIYDFVVIPPGNTSISHSVKKIITDELLRVKEFGLLATNSADVISYIEELKTRYDAE